MHKPPRVYLAGPDVFLADPVARGDRLRALCAERGLHGVFPLDPLDAAEPAEWASLPEWERIARRNEGHILSCDALIANLTPFRGPSADVGTVFELGFMRALGRPVFGWSNVATGFEQRTRALCGIAGERDAEGMAVESFGCTDNLMIDGAIRSSGGILILADVPAERKWLDLVAFERCVAACASQLAP